MVSALTKIAGVALTGDTEVAITLDPRYRWKLTHTGADASGNDDANSAKSAWLSTLSGTISATKTVEDCKFELLDGTSETFGPGISKLYIVSTADADAVLKIVRIGMPVRSHAGRPAAVPATGVQVTPAETDDRPEAYWDVQAALAVSDAPGVNDPFSTGFDDLRENWVGYLVGFGATGTATSGFVGTGAFASPYAIRLDGTDDYVFATEGTLGAAAARSFPAHGAVEIAFYVATVDWGDNKVLCAFPYNIFNNGFMIRCEVDKSVTAIIGDGVGADIIPIAGDARDAWHHLLISWDTNADTMTVWKDGTKVADATAATRWPTGSNRWAIGGSACQAAKIALFRYYHDTTITDAHAAVLWADVGRLWNAFSQDVKLSVLRPDYHALVGEVLSIPLTVTGTYDWVRTSNSRVTFSADSLHFTPTFVDGGSILDVTVRVQSGANHDSTNIKIYVHHDLSRVTSISHTGMPDSAAFSPKLVGATWHATDQELGLLSKLAHSTSPDLLTWTEVDDDCIVVESGSDYLLGASVLPVGTEYWAYTSERNGSSVSAIWRTVINAGWTTFTKDEAACVSNALTDGVPVTGFNRPHVFKTGSTYHMLCSALGSPDEMAHFTSTDGTTWATVPNHGFTKYGVALSRYDRAWDASYSRLDPGVLMNSVGVPAANAHGNYELVYVIYYLVGETVHQKAGSAISTDGVNWKMYRGAIWERDDVLGDVNVIALSATERRVLWSEAFGDDHGFRGVLTP